MYVLRCYKPKVSYLERSERAIGRILFFVVGGLGFVLLGEVSRGGWAGLVAMVGRWCGLSFLFLSCCCFFRSSLILSMFSFLPLPSFNLLPSLLSILLVLCPSLSTSRAFLLLSLLFHLSISSSLTTHSIPKIPMEGSFNPAHSSHHFLSTSVLSTTPIFTICSRGIVIYVPITPRIRTILHSEMVSQGI